LIKDKARSGYGLKMKILILTILMSFFNSASAVDIGEHAPDFELQTMEGDSFKLSDHIGKKPVYLVFWATWCPICKAEIPNVKTIHQQLSDRITILAINVGQEDSVNKIKKYREDNQLPYQLAFDEGSKISRRYGVIGTPWQVIIDVNGKIQYRSSRTPINMEQHLDKLNFLDKRNEGQVLSLAILKKVRKAY